ncbi:glycosyltransferase [Streptococcus pluranimalium]|uniref:glycosyltransferase n=1 Tax=Streptococcus pluranimalium TaxID=82348 RepID=UPI003F68D58D
MNESVNKPIRILHMIGSLNIGGSQTMVMNLYRNLNREKIQFDFIVDRKDELFYAQEIEELGGRIYYFPTFNGKNIFSLKKLWKAFLQEHDNYKAIHFHVRSYISLIIPTIKKFNIPIISHSHSISSGSDFSAKIKNILQYPIRYQANYFLACSDEAGMWLFGKNILRNKNYFTVKNAIDGEKYFFDENLRDSVRSEFGLTESQYLFGSVGRATQVKNQLFLIEIFYELQKEIDSKLIIIGDGELLPLLKNRAEELGIGNKCIFPGNIKNVEKYYHAMDSFIFPSLWEGLGISVVEAETSGLKCFVSNNVPKSVDIGSNLINVIDLEHGASLWADEIVNKLDYNRVSPIKDFYVSGYDIRSNSKWYENFYTSITI